MVNANFEFRQLTTALGIEPAYLVETTSDFRSLTASERKYMWGQGEVVAFTCAIADILFNDYLRYDWRGRGFCVAFRQSPLLMTRTEFLGVVVHEAAHYIAESGPERDDPDFDRAAQAFWKSMRPEAEHHDQRWLRALTHLWWRANGAGYEIPFASVCNLEQYGYNQSHLKPYIAEASAREEEPIESILREQPRQPAAASTPRRHTLGNVAWVAGQPVTFGADGSITTAPDLFGRGSKKFPSTAAFLASLRQPA